MGRAAEPRQVARLERRGDFGAKFWALFAEDTDELAEQFAIAFDGIERLLPIDALSGWMAVGGRGVNRRLLWRFFHGCLHVLGNFLYHTKELLGADGFGDVGVHPGVQASLAITLHGMCRESHDWYVAASAL